MSLTRSLASAASGLLATSRQAAITADNLANLQTPGFGRRAAALSALRGGGVLVTSVTRHADPAITGARREAVALTAGGTFRAGFLQRLEDRLGLPSEPGSLTGRIVRLEQALAAATESPGTGARLVEVLSSAQNLAGGLRALSDSVQGERAEADRSIARDVAALNGTLEQIAMLNRDVVRAQALGQDTSALIDHRQRLVDTIAEIIPIREVARAGGQVALYSLGGAVLLDGRPAEFGFAPTGTIVAGMTLAGGALSGLTLNGRPMTMEASGMLQGGRLAAAFDVRDRLAPQAQMRLDALARDLIERVTDADATLAPGAPGLFTDAGAAFDPAVETGLAGRIAVNALADPDHGGALWRLRDGMGAAVPGSVSDPAGLAALAAALQTGRPAASGDFVPGARSLAGLAGEVLSLTAVAHSEADLTLAFGVARVSALTQMEAEGGVDSDAEMQMLLLLEQSYAANARVIQAVDAMLARILEI